MSINACSFSATRTMICTYSIDMAHELLRRNHVLIVCGDEVDESVKNDIAVAQRLGITATALDGI